MAHSTESGSAKLTMVMSIAVTVGAFMMTTMTITSSKVFQARQQSYEARSKALASAGVEAAVTWVKRAQSLATLQAPFHGFDGLSTTDWTQIHDDEVVLVNGQEVGHFDVWIRQAQTSGTNPLARDLEIRSEGYYHHGKKATARGAVDRAVIRVNLRPSEVFDYSYFINNWGWLYVNDLTANGNVRANGQFDFGGYRPIINSSPRYQSIVRRPDGTHDLIGQVDAGGVFSGWDIANAQNVRGHGGNAANQYAFQEQLPMPNLTDLGIYESLARQEASSITVSHGLASPITYQNVIGDDPGEPRNLYLEGTLFEPDRDRRSAGGARQRLHQRLRDRSGSHLCR